MPYINQFDRTLLKDGAAPKTAGELNYLIHLEIEKEVKLKGESYSTYNDIIGALEVLIHGFDVETPQKWSFMGSVSRLLYQFNQDIMGDVDKFTATLGALKCAQFELYRRKIAEYENKKAIENGDIEFYANNS